MTPASVPSPAPISPPSEVPEPPLPTESLSPSLCRASVWRSLASSCGCPSPTSIAAGSAVVAGCAVAAKSFVRRCATCLWRDGELANAATTANKRVDNSRPVTKESRSCTHRALSEADFVHASEPRAPRPHTHTHTKRTLGWSLATHRASSLDDNTPSLSATSFAPWKRNFSWSLVNSLRYVAVATQHRNNGTHPL